MPEIAACISDQYCCRRYIPVEIPLIDEGKALVSSNISVPMNNFEDYPSSNVISRACEEYAQAGNTFSLVFGGCPDGWLDLLGAGIQGYISGDKEWSTVVEEAKTNWAEMRQ